MISSTAHHPGEADGNGAERYPTAATVGVAALLALTVIFAQGLAIMSLVEVGLAAILGLVVAGGLFYSTRSWSAAVTGAALALAVPVSATTLTGAIVVAAASTLALILRSPLPYGLGLLGLNQAGPVGAAVVAVAIACLLASASGRRFAASPTAIVTAFLAGILATLSLIRHGQPVAVIGAVSVGLLVWFVRLHPRRAAFSRLVGRTAPWALPFPAVAFFLVAAIDRFPDGYASLFLLGLGWSSVALGLLLLPLLLGAEAFLASSDPPGFALVAGMAVLPAVVASGLLASGTSGAVQSLGAAWPIVVWPAIIGIGRLRRLGTRATWLVSIVLVVGLASLGVLRVTGL